MRRLPGALLTALLTLGVGAPCAFAAPPSAASAPAGERASPGKGRAAALHGVVNLNTADEAALELLPGVGPTKSSRIVEHRKAHPFRRAEEITRVKGFGRKSFARLKPFLAVTGATTLALDSPPSSGKAATAP